MSQAPKPAHVPATELDLLDIKVTRDGGEVRYLEGAKYGLSTSIYRSEVVPGSGPSPHTHPYTEFFVVNEGVGRFTVGGATIDARAGDVVIVPPGLVHSFTNPGPDMLSQTAIHEAPIHAMDVVKEAGDG